MECRDAQFYLRLKRHAAGGDELGPDVGASLDGHLVACPACAADSRAAASFDRAVASAMRSVPVPTGLRDQLVAHVAAKQGAILRGRLYRFATGAAASIVVAFLVLAWFSSNRPKLDTNLIAEVDGKQFNEPEEATKQWLASQKLPDHLPLPFDYTLLASQGKKNVQGIDVPVVTFRSPDPLDRGFAKVYIVREDGRFDLSNVHDTGNSHVLVMVIHGEREFRGFMYVVVYTGGPQGLQQFLVTRNGGGMPGAI